MYAQRLCNVEVQSRDALIATLSLGSQKFMASTMSGDGLTVSTQANRYSITSPSRRNCASDKWCFSHSLVRMRQAQNGVKWACRAYATISSGVDVKGKAFLTLEHVGTL